MSDLLISGLAGLAAFMIALSSVKKSNENETVGGGIKEDEKLISASRNGHLDVVKDLLAAGANVNHQDKNGYTALMWASRDGHLAVVNVLLAARANVNHQNMYGKTALILASDEGRLDVVKTLLAAGASVNHQNTYEQTALMWASMGGHLDVVKALLAAGANVNHQTMNGSTALLWAIVRGHLDVVKALLAAGANVNHQTMDGSTVLMWAIERGHLDVVKLLIEYARTLLKEEIRNRTYALSKAAPGFRSKDNRSEFRQYQIYKSFWGEECKNGAKSNHLRLLAFAARLGLIDVNTLQLPLKEPQELCREIDRKLDQIIDPR